jgi:serine/threonine-protein kinase
METGSLMDGRYALVRAVSRGGFSQVFEARDRSDGDRRVAVKILNMPDGDDRGVRHRFAQEVAALRSVHHPGVIPILNSWIEADGNPCIAMPFLEGCTLREALAGGSLEPARAARLIQQIGSAMETVHRHGIVHRDLKPENLMLTTGEDGNESAVIIDFGTAGLRAAEHSLAVTTMLAGSFHYMAPERLTGRYSPASDLYSFAVIIIEMLTGKRLSDFESVGSGQFVGDLKMGLLTVLPPSTAETMAGMLCQALELDPLKRPARVAPWSAGIAAACPQS